ncbi:hypothetical protein C0992_011548, partial [Termitomyces sp. T32_za158]
VLRSNEASVPEAGPVPAAAAPLAPGQFTPVPGDAHVSMEDASTEVVTKALRRSWGPPTHEWCLANSPCSHCARCNAPCVFPEPVVGVQRDTSMCEACRSNHKRCSTSRLWKARCVVREQGWGPGESQAVAAGPGLEEAELRRERDRGLVQIQAQAEELARARRERDKAVLARDQLLRERGGHPGQREALEGEVGDLLTRLVRAAGLEGLAGVAVPSAAEVDELARRLREAHALESRRREWLLWEVVAARGEALDWAWEHRLLLDGLSSEVSYVVEEAS